MHDKVQIEFQKRQTEAGFWIVQIFVTDQGKDPVEWIATREILSEQEPQIQYLDFT